MIFECASILVFSDVIYYIHPDYRQGR